MAPAGMPNNAIVLQVLMPASVWCSTVMLLDVAALEYQCVGAGDRYPFMLHFSDMLSALLALWLDTAPAERPTLNVYHIK